MILRCEDMTQKHSGSRGMSHDPHTNARRFANYFRTIEVGFFSGIKGHLQELGIIRECSFEASRFSTSKSARIPEDSDDSEHEPGCLRRPGETCNYCAIYQWYFIGTITEKTPAAITNWLCRSQSACAVDDGDPERSECDEASLDT